MEYNKGLYVHIPFCDHICAYCDFARQIYHESTVDKYLDALHEDIKHLEMTDVTTLYIGGGTPSSLNPKQLERLLRMLEPYSKSNVEYTMEVNPESLTKEKVEVMERFGVNRVSMGLQVTQTRLLEIVDRQHDIETVKQAINLLHNGGISNISVDLMYGIPSQTLEDWKESLQQVVALDITHLSLYALTIEPHSMFGKKGYKEVDGDTDADMYEMAKDTLNKHNFIQYEVSNFSKKGFESKHNRVYWHYQDYYAVGLNAAGKDGNIRYNNTRSMNEYLKGNFRDTEDVLTQIDYEFEYIMMNLRLIEGLDLENYTRIFKDDFKIKYKIQIKELYEEGLAVVQDTHLRTTSKGMMLLHNVIDKFLA